MLLTIFCNFFIEESLCHHVRLQLLVEQANDAATLGEEKSRVPVTTRHHPSK